jgi:HAD superfamily hydrolase (TIGR01450 family)
MSGNLVCDLDGVVYRGSDPVPESATALAALEAAGWRIIFSTNNSSRTSAEVAARIGSITGYAAKPDQVVTSALAAADLLSDTKPLTFVLGGVGVTAALEAEDIPVTQVGSDAGAVVVGLATGLTYDWLREASAAVMRGARLIATNDDPTFPAEDGLWPGAGAILAAVERASGVTAEVAGKPFPPMRSLIRKRLGPGPVWVVGDRADTDLALAWAEPGWHAALVLTGVATGQEVLQHPPDLVASDLAEFARVLLG